VKFALKKTKAVVLTQSYVGKRVSVSVETRELGGDPGGTVPTSAMPICAPSSDSSASSPSGGRAWIVHGLALGAAAAAAAAAAYLYRRPSGFRSRAVGIIPARFASSRFEGKPLAHILGKPMIQVRACLPCLIASDSGSEGRLAVENQAAETVTATCGWHCEGRLSRFMLFPRLFLWLWCHFAVVRGVSLSDFLQTSYFTVQIVSVQ
jgi:hypothetical protein